MPALFDAVHLKMPRCLPLIDSMLNDDSRGDIRVTVNPFTPLTINWPLSAHLMSNGKSPLLIMQLMALLSPGLAGSSPKVNGTMCGTTVNDNIDLGECTMHNMYVVGYFRVCSHEEDTKGERTGMK